MDTSNLMDALNGGDSTGGGSAFDVTPPMAPPGGASPNVPAPQNTDLGAAPDIGGQPTAGQPIATNTPGPAKPTGQPSVWKDIVMGALNGLAGSAGQTHFGGGLAAGAKGVFDAKQRELENQQAAQRQAAALKFQSAQSAHMMAETSLRIREGERAEQEFREREADRNQNIADFMEANGFKPGTSFQASNDKEFHAAATGGLPVLASQNNGTIPPTVVVSQPYGTGKNKGTDDITAYPITAQHMQSNPNGARSIVDAYLTASRGYASTDDEWKTGLGTLKANNVPSQGTEYKAQQQAAQQSAVATAMRYFQRPTLPKTEAGKIDNGQVASMSAQFHQELTNYQQRPNADPSITKLLQNKADSFDELSNDAMNKQSQLESQQIAGVSVAQGQAAALKVVAENSGAAGDAKANQKAREARIDQAVKSGNPADAGQMLADRTTTISELKSRGLTPGYVTSAVAEARKYDPNYNPVVADNEAKIAGSEANNQFFGNVNSLVATGGTLDQLKQAGDKISKSDYQILNKAKNWKDLQTGKGGISAYAAKAVGVADDYSKVMGGSVGSDASRNLVLHIISPDLAPDQRAEAIEAVRDSVNSQKESRIGNNSFLRKMYSTMPTNSQPKGADFFKQHGGQVSQ